MWNQIHQIIDKGACIVHEWNWLSDIPSLRDHVKHAQFQKKIGKIFNSGMTKVW